MASTRGPKMRLSRRLVSVGFWFFLAKGLLWLVAPAMAWFAMS